MTAILPAARPALGCMTEAEIAALDAPPLTAFHAFLLTVPADGTPPGDLAAELRDELTDGCLPAAECTPAGVAAHLAARHTTAAWVPGALARLVSAYRAAAHPEAA